MGLGGKVDANDPFEAFGELLHIPYTPTHYLLVPRATGLRFLSSFFFIFCFSLFLSLLRAVETVEAVEAVGECASEEEC